jgi:predicted nucleotidyltransferase
MSEAAYARAMARFAAAAEAEPLVLAAFLGGSRAGGRVHAGSDLDVYVVTTVEDYPAFWAKRRAFIQAWGEVDVLRDFENFDGLGFDLVQFEFADGVHGELAVGHTENLLAIHGGPYEVYVDRTGLLDGVVFPLL